MIKIKLYNEDCIELMRNMNDESVDLVVTDPPYLINYSRHDKNSRFNKTIKNDDNQELIRDYVNECYRILKDNSACYIFCNYKRVDCFKQVIEDAGFNIKNIIIWDKEAYNIGDLSTTYDYSYEMVIFCSKGQPKIGGKRLKDLISVKRVSRKEQVHPNQKPVELLNIFISKSSDKGDVVFDGFMGSGSTGVACKNICREFIGVELDRDYYYIACERLNK